MAFRSLNGEGRNTGFSGGYSKRHIIEMNVVKRIYSYMAANEDQLTMNEALKLISLKERRAVINEENTKGVKSLINKHQDLFMISQELPNGPDVIKPVVDIEFCKVFDSKQGCSDKDCEKLHVCRHFVKGKCTFGSKCKKPHQFHDPHTQEILQKHCLDGLTHSQLKDFLCRNVQFALDDSVDESSLPKQMEICKYYNVAIGCSRDEQCPFLHICRFFAEEGTCKFGPKCIRKHNFCNDHSRKLLSRYNIDETNALSYLRKKVGQSKHIIDDEILSDNHHNMSSKNLNPRAFLNITNLKQEFRKPRAHSLDIMDITRTCAKEKDVYRKMSEPANGKQSSDELFICENGILGICSAIHCPKVHHRSPFRWQYSTDGVSWKDVGECENINIEAKYVDVGADDVVVFLENKHKFVFKFSQQVGIQQNELPFLEKESGNAPPVVVQIRRLSTLSLLRNIDCKDITYTIWNWYYLDECNNWRCYNEDFMSFSAISTHKDNSMAIEIAFSDPRRKSFQYQRGANNFVIDFKNFTQENIETREITRVRRRPQSFAYSFKRIEEETFAEKSFFPSYWKTASLPGLPENQCELLELNQKTKEYMKVFMDFKDSFGNVHISNIMAVQNTRLWMTYAMKRDNLEEMNSGKAEEKLLYRASTLEKGEIICKYGFEVGVSLSQEFSNKEYFARDARLANRNNISNQAGLFVMFLCKVLTNSCVTARLDEREAILECYPPSRDLSMYYIFDSDHIYPEFVIMFKVGDLM